MRDKVAIGIIVLAILGLFAKRYLPDDFGDNLPFPKSQIAWVVIVEESTEREPIVASIVTSGWLQSSKDKGFLSTIADKDSPTGKQYEGVIGGKDLPVAVVMDVENKLLGVVELPEKIDQLDSTLQGVGRYAD
jgi:hypothetical protein